jgi:hypothetical protein
MKKHLPQFTEKVLSVLCSGEDTGQLIYDPSFEDQGGRLFMAQPQQDVAANGSQPFSSESKSEVIGGWTRR